MDGMKGRGGGATSERNVLWRSTLSTKIVEGKTKEDQKRKKNSVLVEWRASISDGVLLKVEWPTGLK